MIKTIIQTITTNATLINILRKNCTLQCVILAVLLLCRFFFVFYVLFAVVVVVVFAAAATVDVVVLVLPAAFLDVKLSLLQLLI